MSDKELTSVSRIRGIYLTLVRRQLESVGLNDITEADRRFGEMIRRVRKEAWEEGFDAGELDAMDNLSNEHHNCTLNPYREDT